MKSMKQYRPYLVEMVGTMVLGLGVILSLIVGTGGISTPVVAALTVGLLVYVIGPVSGCHLNPAVSIALAIMGRISKGEAVKYTVAQVIGAGTALALVLFMYQPTGTISFTSPESWGVLIAEFIATAIFVFGLMSVVMGKVSRDASGLVVGGFLLIGIITAIGLGSAGVLNPAMAIALGTISISYIVGTIAGAIAGVWLYQLLCE